MSERSDRVARWLAERELDALLVSDAVNLRYLLGFTGTNGLALVGARGARLFLTDFRYSDQAAEQVDAGFERRSASVDLLEAIVPALAAQELGGDGTLRLGFDDAHISYKQHGRLKGMLGEGVSLVPASGLIERLRAVKDVDEVRRIAAAAELIDGVLAWLAERGLAGRNEREVAIDIEHEMRCRGAQGPSFPSIVASGAHSALPHAEPRDEVIASGTLVTVDLGASLDGYCSDCTRTFATGPVDEEQRSVYDLVLRAQMAALGAIEPGPTGREVDAVGRELIDAAGQGDRFGHGLGHGVGMEIHEAPRLGRVSGTEPLQAGHVVTVEPGVYLPGRFGVRIEDLVVITEDGCERLSRFPKELIDVG